MSRMKEKTLHELAKEFPTKSYSELEEQRTIQQDPRGELDLTLQIEKLQSRIKELGEINKLHQELNGKLQTRLTDVEEDNKKLSDQVADYIKKYENSIRKAGL
jgi:chromosome segregation ATPase